MAIEQEAINEPVVANVRAEACGPGNERFATRRKCNIPATAFMPEQAISVSCRIIDMSAMGAGIVVSSARMSQGLSRQTLPEWFWLRLAHDGSQVRCQVVWQEQDTYGVRFVSPMQPMARRRRADPVKREQPCKKKGLFGFGKARG